MTALGGVLRRCHQCERADYMSASETRCWQCRIQDFTPAEILERLQRLALYSPAHLNAIAAFDDFSGSGAVRH